jgi:hypothetical protein
MSRAHRDGAADRHAALQYALHRHEHRKEAKKGLKRKKSGCEKRRKRKKGDPRAAPSG